MNGVKSLAGRSLWKWRYSRDYSRSRLHLRGQVVEQQMQIVSRPIAPSHRSYPVYGCWLVWESRIGVAAAAA